MDSQRRSCEKIVEHERIDLEIDSVVHDLENWQKHFSNRSVSFELGPRPNFNLEAPLQQNFVVDIQQLMDLFDSEKPSNDFQDIASLSHSFAVEQRTEEIPEIIEKEEKTVDGISSEDTQWQGKSDYFKVKNPSELFKLNQSFVDELKDGANHFAISSVMHADDRISTCWGIASAMNFMMNRQVAIICEKVSDEYRRLAPNMERGSLQMTRYGTELQYWRAGGITIYSIYDFVDVIYNLSPAAVQTFLNEFAHCVGIVIWDLPTLSEVDAKRHLYIPVFEALSSLSVVVNRGEDMRQLDKLVRYYQRYGVKILGAIYGKKEQEV